MLAPIRQDGILIVHFIKHAISEYASDTFWPNNVVFVATPISFTMLFGIHSPFSPHPPATAPFCHFCPCLLPTHFSRPPERFHCPRIQFSLLLPLLLLPSSPLLLYAPILPPSVLPTTPPLPPYLAIRTLTLELSLSCCPLRSNRLLLACCEHTKPKSPAGILINIFA